jgi:hypothetical protein
VAGTQHVDELAHALRVEDGLVEGALEVERAEHCHVGVGALAILE